MKTISIATGLAALCLANASSANALGVSRNGVTITLSGGIVPGDHIRFREAMQGARIVNLNSSGGNIAAALEVARLIRAAGMATVVDAARANCQSACTVIFAGGARRHYINAGAIADHGGRRGERGLGFHEGNAFGASGRRQQSGGASASMINAYYEMGMGGAAKFVPMAAFRDMYYLSGATALSSGVATSLSPP
jgi:hypothetical protein